jgi:hypothetical protein
VLGRKTEVEVGIGVVVCRPWLCERAAKLQLFLVSSHLIEKYNEKSSFFLVDMQ